MLWEDHARAATLNRWNADTAASALGIVITEVGDDFVRHAAGGCARTRQPWPAARRRPVLLAETLAASPPTQPDPSEAVAVGLTSTPTTCARRTRSRSRARHGQAAPGAVDPVWEIRIENAAAELACIARRPWPWCRAAPGRRGVNQAPYARLSPDCVLDAVATLGLMPDGRLLALNSYENRVYQVGIEDSRAAGGEVLPSRSLERRRHRRGARLRPRAGRRRAAGGGAAGLCRRHPAAPRRLPLRLIRAAADAHASLESAEHLAWMGARWRAQYRYRRPRAGFPHRGHIDLDSFLRAPRDAVLASPCCRPRLRPRYRAAVDALEAHLAPHFAPGAFRALMPARRPPPGNVLWTDSGPHFVDLDDARPGSGDPGPVDARPDRRAALDALLEGYAEFREPDYARVVLIEPLRLLRQIHWAGWIAALARSGLSRRLSLRRRGALVEQHVNDLLDAARARTESALTAARRSPRVHWRSAPSPATLARHEHRRRRNADCRGPRLRRGLRYARRAPLLVAHLLIALPLALLVINPLARACACAASG